MNTVFVSFVKGLYYMTKPKDGICKLYLTNAYIANILYLSGDFSDFSQTYIEYR